MSKKAAVPVLDGKIRYPKIKVRLSGSDGNAFAIMANVRRAMLDKGVSDEEISLFLKECKSGDYDHLLQTCTKWVDVR
jgi:hypothetical protein